ncbi:MAG: endonuclease domain-containing protein [Deltaproteobacteria bacterium]|nr:endonuclease domain-containing protein [Deltaproteobacteria bacterium]
MKIEAKTFRFTSYEFQAKKATAYLRYAADEIDFEEKLIFAGANPMFNPDRIKAINHLLYYLHIAAGISYYKAFIPDVIEVETRPMSESTARFFEKFYFHGLGEFAFRNNLDLKGRIKFPSGDSAKLNVAPLNLKRRTAVPIGGGKDSVVTLEILKRKKEPLLGVSVGQHSSIEEIAAIAEVPLLQIRRFLSPNLFELNKQGALNGHVPIVGILSFIFLVAAILYDFDAIAMSNERSADSGNMLYKGSEINHQWSKSSEFETTFQRLIKNEMTRDVAYFSILRPLSEFQIAQLFATTPKYHQAFSSCNSAYKITDSNESKWCCECDKCRFVFLILSPFLGKDALINIFSKNLFEEKSYSEKYEELLGLKGYKPFECVGEFEESQAALYLINNSPDWADTPVIKNLMKAVNQKKIDLRASFEKAIKFSQRHWMPQLYQSAIYEITRIAKKKYNCLGGGA